MIQKKYLVALVLYCLGFGAVLSSSIAASTTTYATVAPNNPFAKPLLLRGTLGDAQIEMHLQLKPDPTEGIQGTYFLFGQSTKILLAGEYEGSDVLMEESVNGKDVSGEWSGKLVGDTFSGTWSTTDDTVTKPFILKVQMYKSVR